MKNRRVFRGARFAAIALLVTAAVTAGGMVATHDTGVESDSIASLPATSTHSTVNPQQGKTSKGVHIYNNTLGKMVLVAEGGDNAGMQPLGETLAPGTGYHDFEVVFRAANQTTDYAVYVIYDPAGNQIGGAKILMTVDEFDDVSVSSQFRANDGSSMPLTTSSYSDGYQVVSNSSTPIDVDADSPTAKALVASYCDTADTAAKCSFTPTSSTPGERMALLAMGYTQPSSPTSGTVSAEAGYNAYTSSSWSVSLSVDTEIGGIFEAGVEATYGKSATWENTFTAGASIPVSPGYTGYIWGNVPTTNYTGVMQVKLGNTVYAIQNVQLSTPDSSRALSDFQTATRQGDDPLNSPDTPPASATKIGLK